MFHGWRDIDACFLIRYTLVEQNKTRRGEMEEKEAVAVDDVDG
jgi:hypothetical protein